MAPRYRWRLAAITAIAASIAIAGCSSSSGNGKNDPASGQSDTGAGSAAAGVSENSYGGQQYSSGTPVNGGVFKFGTLTPVATLDPSVPVGSSSEGTDEAIFGKLMTLNSAGEAVPQMAKSMTSSDGGTVWTLTLPAGMKFTDGTAFNAQAVITYLKRLAAPTSESLQASSIREIKSMTAENAQTVVMTLYSPDVTFDDVFTSGSPAMIPSPTAVAKEGSQFGLHPVGAGPFEVKSFQPNGTVDLVANPDYIGSKPHVAEIQYIPVPDDLARLQAVRSGSLDAAAIGTAEDYASAQSDGLTVLKQPTDTYYALLVNLKQPPFNDASFRTAVIEAIDLTGLNEAAFDGSETVVSGLVAPSNPYYEKTDWPTYNLSNAKKLVDEYTSKTGKPVSFKLVIPDGPAYSEIASVLQQMLSQAGITMTYSVATPQEMVISVGAGTYQAQMRPEGISTDFAPSVATDFASNSSLNQGLAGDPALDVLIAKAKTATSNAALTAIYDQMQDVLTAWEPQIPLVTQSYGFYINSRVGGFPGGSIETLPALDLFNPTAVWLKQG